MKLIIDIDEAKYEWLNSYPAVYNSEYEQIIADGIPINTDGDLISRSALREEVNTFYDNHFKGLVPNELIKYAKAVDNAIDNASTVKDEIKWHNLKENPNDKPTKVGWYCCKISSSDDLKMVFGQSEVMSGMYDAWLLVSCPY